MSESEHTTPAEPWRSNPVASGRTVSPLFPEAIGEPKTNERRPPGEGVDAIEMARVFAVLGLLTLAFVFFYALMLILHLTVF